MASLHEGWLPYSDDPRLAVKEVMFCGTTGILVIGGTAGQVIAATMGEQSESATVVCRADTVTEKEWFTWKGHKPLDIKTGAIKQPARFQPKCVLQVSLLHPSPLCPCPTGGGSWLQAPPTGWGCWTTSSSTWSLQGAPSRHRILQMLMITQCPERNL